MIQIDGTYGEGGGQIIRSCLTLSAITGMPFEIMNIRGGRAKPGLQAQHLRCVRAVAQLTGAVVVGDALGSVFLSFTPTCPVVGGRYRFEIDTAGSSILLLQTILLPLVLAEESSNVTVTGGTHNPFAPIYDYFDQVVTCAFGKFGMDFKSHLISAGHFPRGGGEVNVEIAPTPALYGIHFDKRSGVGSTSGTVITSGLPLDVGKRGAQSLAQTVAGTSIRSLDLPSPGTGAAVLVAVQGGGCHAGFTSLGARGKRMETVAQEAGDAYRTWQKGTATVDEHLADQLILPAALAKSPSSWQTDRVTDHLRTMAWLVPQFLPVSIEISENGRVVVTP